MKQQILFIINPISGTDKKVLVRQAIQKLLDRDKYDYTVRYTTHGGHAEELAREAAAAGVPIVCAVGGDGTVNEVARAIVHTPTALGIIPCGSGNGLARHLQIPMDPVRAVEVLNAGVIHSLDYGRINGQPFFCTCGMGFDAFVSQRFSESGKRGFVSYVENTLREGLNYRPDTYTVENENGTILGKAFLIACANASQYGNNAFIAPHASMKDGLMDVTIIEPFSTLESGQIALQLFTGTLPSNSHVKTFRARKLHIERQHPGAIHVDGDPIEAGREFDVELIAGQFRVVVNPKAKSKKRTLLQFISDYIRDPENFQADIRRSGQSLYTINKSILELLKKL